jgi:predicted nucleic acid-binding protein
MRIVIDTNIIFSSLVNSNGTIAEIIIGSKKKYHFYTSEYLHFELKNHRKKLKKASNLTDIEIENITNKLFKYINLITLEIIPEKHWIKAEALVSDVDPDDIAFVALSLYLDAYLWTGDKVLYQGLKKKGFDKILLTPDLKAML